LRGREEESNLKRTTLKFFTDLLKGTSEGTAWGARKLYIKSSSHESDGGVEWVGSRGQANPKLDKGEKGEEGERTEGGCGENT